MLSRRGSGHHQSLFQIYIVEKTHKTIPLSFLPLRTYPYSLIKPWKCQVHARRERNYLLAIRLNIFIAWCTISNPPLAFWIAWNGSGVNNSTTQYTASALPFAIHLKRGVVLLSCRLDCQLLWRPAQAGTFLVVPTGLRTLCLETQMKCECFS
jgi:hypothetical protein